VEKNNGLTPKNLLIVHRMYYALQAEKNLASGSATIMPDFVKGVLLCQPASLASLSSAILATIYADFCRWLIQNMKT
jgi:hypothetical protein